MFLVFLMMNANRISGTNAIFVDKEKSSENFFIASTWTEEGALLREVREDGNLLLGDVEEISTQKETPNDTVTVFDVAVEDLSSSPDTDLPSETEDPIHPDVDTPDEENNLNSVDVDQANDGSQITESDQNLTPDNSNDTEDKSFSDPEADKERDQKVTALDTRTE